MCNTLTMPDKKATWYYMDWDVKEPAADLYQKSNDAYTQGDYLYSFQIMKALLDSKGLEDPAWLTLFRRAAIKANTDTDPSFIETYNKVKPK